MAGQKPVIRAESFVYGKNGELIPFESLSEEQKRKVATELKIRMMSALFPGVRFFAAEEAQQTD